MQQILIEQTEAFVSIKMRVYCIEKYRVITEIVSLGVFRNMMTASNKTAFSMNSKEKVLALRELTRYSVTVKTISFGNS